MENSIYYSLDLESNLQAALQDPGFLISQYRSRCLILDEIQKAPILIGEIKYAVDHDHRCGQFVLTGSSDYRRLPHANESLAGRVDFCPAQNILLGRANGSQAHVLETHVRA